MQSGPQKLRCCKLPLKSKEYPGLNWYEENMINTKSTTLRGHPLSTYEDFSEKLTFLTP